MAASSTIHRLTLELADSDRGVYETLELTAARHPSETALRLCARLLAYGLAYRQGIAFTKGISAGDEPDIWAHDDTGALTLWVEVGLPPAERLRKAARRAPEVMLFTYGNRRVWDVEQLPLLREIGRLTVTPLDDAFLEALAARLQRTMRWALTVCGGMIYLAFNDETLEAPLAPL